MRRLGNSITGPGLPLVVSVLVVATLGAGAGAGESFGLDPSFGKSGLVVVDPPGDAEEYGNALATFPDGSVVVAGAAVPDPHAIPGPPLEPEMPSVPEVPNRTPSFPSTPQSLGPVIMLLRFLPDGSLDPGFGNGGRVWTDLFKESLPANVQGAFREDTPPGAAAAYTVLALPDGRILVGGTTAAGSSLGFALVRYLPDGTLDRSFGEGGAAVTDVDPNEADSVGALVIEPHGRILAVGHSGIRGAVVRYLPDGRLDPSFGENGQTITPGYKEGIAAALDSRQRLVVAGQAGDSLDGPYDFAIARYLPNGHLDPGFGRAGVTVTDLGNTGEFATGINLNPDGTILTTGSSGASFALARYRSDGALDEGFKDGGKALAETGAAGRASARLPDGRMLLGGGVYGNGSRDVAFSRFLADGSVDPTFGNKGVVANDVGGSRDDEAFSAAYVTDKLVVTGTSYKDQTEPLVFLFRYTS